MTHRIHEWFRDVAQEVQGDWERLHAAAQEDAQKAGHGGEATWAELLRKWLPSSYEVATRKYILPETEGAPEPSEIDIVIFNPGYPEAFRGREEVLAGGVAAAFSVRLTLFADGIRDGTSRAAEIRRHIRPRYGSVRGELLAPFPVGLLAHSHGWQGEASTPTDNVTTAATKHEAELVQHPRESLDLICVADLGTWALARLPFIETVGPPRAGTSRIEAHPELSPMPVASFVTHLLRSLSYADSTLRPMTAGLEALNMLAIGAGEPRFWDLDEVFSEEVRNQIPMRLDRENVDWQAVYY
jgi:Domain of unknown function (DUF6602)